MASSPKPRYSQVIAQRDYDFVERPSHDFFCPVTLELLLEPQLTSCCGHHLSLAASSRLQREGKACPLCYETGWSTVLDKFHRRRVHELRVRCPHRGGGCDWVGEVSGVERHASCCPKRVWECPFCGLKCAFEEGKEGHWPKCSKFPEPCPNGCEMGTVERCNLEQHHNVCSLEPVSCEMKEFGCNAVVPRKDLATHMRESELQHLTDMAVLNLRLTRQLQQDLAKKDVKIAQLQQEMVEQRQMQTEMRREVTEWKQLQNKEFAKQWAEVKGEIIEHKQEMKKEMTVLGGRMQQVHNSTQHIEVHTAGLCGLCTPCKVFTFDQYSQRKGSGKEICSDPFYSYQHGYKFKLCTYYYTFDVGAHLYLLTGQYDDQLSWPVNVKVCLEVLNQAGDHHHVEKTKTWNWGKDSRNIYKHIHFMKYSDLEKQGDCVQYMMNDCLKFRLYLTVQAA